MANTPYIEKITGPKYRDPNRLIVHSDDPNDPTDRQIQNDLKNEQSRNDFIDRMADSFYAYSQKPNMLTVEEMNHFAPLYSEEIRKKVLNNTISEDEYRLIEDLSLEFNHRIDVHQPIHVVDENGQDVMPPLPPIFMRLDCLHGDLVDVVNNVHTAFANDDGNAGGITDLKKHNSLANLALAMRSQQAAQSIYANEAMFKRQADEVNKFMHQEEIAKAQEEDPLIQQARIHEFKKMDEPLPPTTTEDYNLEYGPVDD